MAQGFVLTPSLANLIAELVRRLRAPTMDLYSPVMRPILARDARTIKQRPQGKRCDLKTNLELGFVNPNEIPAGKGKR